MDDFYELLEPIVTKVANAVCRQFPNYIDKQDVVNDLWERVYKERKNFDEMLGKEGWEKLAFWLLKKEAYKVVLAEDAAINGYDQEDVFNYRLEVIRELLEVVFNYQDWQSFSTFGEGGPRATTLVNQTGDYVAMLIDVKAATERLPDEQYNALLWHYKYQYTNAMLADELDISEEAAKKRVQRSVGALQRELGRRELSDLRLGYSKRTGRMHGAEARATVERDYEG